MAGKNTAAFGIYSTQAQAEAAVDALKNAGYRNTDISVLFPENQGSKDFAIDKDTKAPEGTATGVLSGGVIGGALGWLAGIGALAIPGLGPFIAAGPIMGLLSGMGVGGAVGGLAGALIGMGIPEYEAKRYEGRVKKGGILMSVHCDNSEWTSRAKQILEQTGAEDVASAGEASSDYGKTDKPMSRSAAGGQYTEPAGTRTGDYAERGDSYVERGEGYVERGEGYVERGAERVKESFERGKDYVEGDVDRGTRDVPIKGRDY